MPDFLQIVADFILPPDPCQINQLRVSRQVCVCGHTGARPIRIGAERVVTSTFH